MRRAANVQLALLSASVIFTSSLVITDKKDVAKQELAFDIASELFAYDANSERAGLTKAAVTHVVSGGKRKVEKSSDAVSASRKRAVSLTQTFNRGSVTRTDAERVFLRHLESNLLLAEALGRGNVSEVHVKAALEDLASKSSMGQPHQSWSEALRTWAFEHLNVERNLKVLQYVRTGILSVLLWAALTMLLGFYYNHEKPFPPKLDPEGVNVSLHDRERLDRQRWRFGLLDCVEVPSLCCFSFLCAPIRWADTMRMAGFMNFIPALALFVALTVLGSFTLGVGFVALGSVCVHYRHRMRQKFDIRSHLHGSYTSDVLALVFCPWCSVAQEARQIEEAYLARHSSVRRPGILRQPWAEYVVRQPGTLRLPVRKV